MNISIAMKNIKESNKTTKMHPDTERNSNNASAKNFNSTIVPVYFT